MKVLIFPLLVAITVIAIYFSSRQKKKRKTKLIFTGSIFIIAFFLLSIGLLGMYASSITTDVQCKTSHSITSEVPYSITTAMDYFSLGNHDYDMGNCKKAIEDYTNSIQLNPNYPQAFNNRAYTYMRMQNYKMALPDLDKALELKPHYIQALMNMGDIHNYYYQIDRKISIADYKRVILLGGTKDASVCGHLFMAMHNGWNIGTIFDIPRNIFSSCY